MTRYIRICIVIVVLILAAIGGCTIATAAVTVNAQSVSPTPTSAEPYPYTGICYTNDGNEYSLQPLIFETPTRIVVPTVTPAATSTQRPTSLAPTSTPKPCAIATGLVLAGTLNIRAGAGTAFPIMGTLKAGEIVDLAQINDAWARLCDGRGWIALKLTDGTQLVKVTTK